MTTSERLAYWESEGFKTGVEAGLHYLAKNQAGRLALDLVRGGPRLEDPRLNVSFADLSMENPVMVGAGWDKKGKAIDALLYLGFGGVEVGTVPLFGQPGNPQPRMEMDWRYGVARNALGFNATGEEAVEANLRTQARNGLVGINVGLNKLMWPEMAPRAHAEVIERLYGYGDYFVINVSSPNTPGLRDFLSPEKEENLRQIIRACRMAASQKPLFLKTTIDLDIQDVYRLIQLCAEEGVDGIIDTNTTTDPELKAKYGWGNKPGGLSGADPEYQARADRRMYKISSYMLKHEIDMARIGVGGISDGPSAIRRLANGAQAVQMVTGIASTRLRGAEQIKEGILKHLDKQGYRNVSELVGSNL